ncbi:MAG: hypothetical protein AAFW69_08000, partial [Pseudomonadota bacterium]
MNLIFGLDAGSNTGAEGELDAAAGRVAAHTTAQFAAPAEAVGTATGPRRLMALGDGGAILGHATEDGVRLALIGVLFAAPPGWSGPAAPLEDPEATARYLLARYRAEGAGFLDGLEGQFAVALQDDAAGRTILAVDPAGIRALWVRERPGGGLDFASNLGTLAAALGAGLALDRGAEDFFLMHGFFPDGRTPFAGIRALAPG